MRRKSIVRPYRWLAEHYDEIFSSFRSPIDAGREQLLRRILPNVKTACDLACGTGTTALALARRGIKMYAVDLSPQMRRAAREKARRARIPIRVLRGDMRSFRLPERVDLITCEYDAVNHVSRRADLPRVARAVERALRPSGHFLFDVNNAPGFRRNWAGNFWVEKPGVVMVMRTGHNREAYRAWVDLEWFIRDGSRWRRKHERVEEVCWSASEVGRVLRKAGFDQVHAWDATPFFKGSNFTKHGCRTFYLARKRRQ